MRKVNILAGLLAHAALACADHDDLTVVRDDTADASLEGDPSTQNIINNLSDCGRRTFSKYAGTRYAMLSLWKNVAGNDSFVTADPDWQGCAMDTHVTPVPKATGSYTWQADLGLVFRADWPPPDGTVPLYSYYAQETRGPDIGTYVYQATPTLFAGTTLRLEGYIYPWHWRKAASGLTELFFHNSATANTDTLTRTVAQAAPADGSTAVTIGYLVDPASVSLDKRGACDSDSDCAASQRCFITKSDSRFSDGTYGSCMKACATDADCNDPAAPRCDFVRQHCVDPLVRYDGYDAVFARNSEGSYQVDGQNLRFEVANKLRWEDRGEGFGPMPLLEGASTNFVIYSNNANPAQWSATNVATSVGTSSPGGHPSINLKVTSTASPLLRYGPGGTVPFLSAPNFTVSMWRRAVSQTGTSVWSERAYVTNGTTIYGFIYPATATDLWSRSEISLTSPYTGASGIGVFESPATVNDQRQVAYVQAEPLAFATSAIATNGAAVTRAADDLRVTSKNLNSRLRFFAVPVADYYALATQTLMTFMDAGGVEQFSIQIEPASGLGRLRVVNGAGTVIATSGSLVTWVKNQMFTLELDHNDSTWTTVRLYGPFGSSTGSVITGLTLPLNIASVRVGARKDGSLPFYGRISEPMPLGTGADTVAPRIFDNRYSLSDPLLPTFAVRFSEHVQSASLQVVSSPRTRTLNLSYGSVATALLGGLLDPGRLHTLNFTATDIAGQIGRATWEVMAPGERFPGPAGELVRLRADACSSYGNVFTWEDLSPNANDALYVAAPGPVLRTWSGPVLKKPVMSFRGAAEQDQLELRALMTAGTSYTAYTMFVAFSRGATTVQPLWTSSNASLSVNASGNVVFTQGGSTLTSSQTLALNTPALAIVRVSSSGLREMWVNGTKVSATLSGTGTVLGGVLGKDAVPNYMTGEMGEFVIYPSALADVDRSALETYMKSRYGIP